MKRGEIYLVERASKIDTKRQRAYVIVSRQTLIESPYSTVICAPIYSTSEGLKTQVEVGIDEGLKHHSCIRCDELVSVRKSELTNYIGLLSSAKIEELNYALKVALDIRPVR